MNNIFEIKRSCLLTTLELHKRANAGHIGASLSSLDILVYLFFHRMNKEEDKLILSKGHAATALYSTLAKLSKIPEEMLDTFYKDGTVLAAHPPCNGVIKDIPFGTGSLGHGLSLAAGIAFSQRYTGKNFQTYCIVSDGDCNEGSTWEAALFAAQHKLRNLTVIVDYNRLQGFGFSEEILNLDSIKDKFLAFGFDVAIADNGNDLNNLDSAFNLLSDTNKPRCIIAHTTKGAGVSFMENKLEWHYLPMNDDQYEMAIKEITNA
ncbi:MAG: transketolase [Bacteroidales bacterium]|jgi:transketolase|nr:transketolase [Bacteroidales bacterium]